MKASPRYGVVDTPQALGEMTRRHRKAAGITLETASALGNIGTRFLSEFERGKETAEIGKAMAALAILGLEVVVRPRGYGNTADRAMAPHETNQEGARRP